jgi:hypothetical protein
MKLANSQASGNIISSQGVQTTSAFGIARTPHMFNILSSGLYSDKIAAVLREISCNAMDAHIMGGTPDKPFQVKLPTSLDRSFYVKDWGPGLDDQEVRELYTTYGWSSKQNSDDVTGAFGLGSKSPFAYTTQNEEDSDGFTIVAVKNGTKRVYTCHIGDEGAPAISRLHEGPADADWQHGVMVTFPVQSRDIAEFHQKAAEIFQWFRVKPEVLGLNRQLATPQFAFKGTFFAMKRKDSGDERSSCVVTGNVRYPITQHRLGELSKTEMALLSSNIHLFLPIGQVMMTPSREELQYTEQTKANLKKHLTAAVLEVAQRVREDVMTPEATKWEWFRKIQTYYETLPFGVQHNIKEFLQAAGVPAAEIEQVYHTVHERTAVVPGWVGDGLSGPSMQFERDDATGKFKRDADFNLIPVTEFDSRGCRVYIYGYDSTRNTVSRREIVNGRVHKGGDKEGKVHLNFLSDVRVYYADDKLADQRVRAALRDRVCDHAMLVMPCKGTPQSFCAEYAERMVGPKGLDGVQKFGVSTLEVPTEVELARERRRLAKELGPRASFADHEVHYLGLNGNVTTATLGELEETDMFYMTATKCDDITRGTVRNKADDYDYSFQGHSLASVMNGMREVAEALNLPVTGVVLVPSEGTARRIKLSEQGFKPFLPYFVQQLKANHQRWLDLVAGIDRTPKVDLSQQWYAKQYGWLGLLAFQAHHKTVFWKRFETEFASSPVTRAVKEFTLNAAQEKDKAAAQSNNLLQGLLALAENLSNHGLPPLAVKQMTHYEVKTVFSELAPSFEALDDGPLVGWMADNPDSALKFFRLALELDGLLDDSSGREVRLAA